jgi:hypothetical protein
MNDDDEAIAIAHGMSDERRLCLIAKTIAADTPQSHRIAEALMMIHLYERARAREAVQWALGNTVH